jgi:hypothetical protein
MPVRTLLRSFAGGELTPEFWSHFDDAKFQSGLALCRNFRTLPHGPGENRPGTQYVAVVVDSTKRTRVIAFVYSTDAELCASVRAPRDQAAHARRNASRFGGRVQQRDRLHHRRRRHLRGRHLLLPRQQHGQRAAELDLLGARCRPRRTRSRRRTTRPTSSTCTTCRARTSSPSCIRTTRRWSFAGSARRSGCCPTPGFTPTLSAYRQASPLSPPQGRRPALQRRASTSSPRSRPMASPSRSRAARRAARTTSSTPARRTRSRGPPSTRAAGYKVYRQSNGVYGYIGTVMSALTLDR